MGKRSCYCPFWSLINDQPYWPRIRIEIEQPSLIRKRLSEQHEVYDFKMALITKSAWVLVDESEEKKSLCMLIILHN